MTKAVRVHKVGGPEALVYEDVDVPAPAALVIAVSPLFACGRSEGHRGRVVNSQASLAYLSVLLRLRRASVLKSSTAAENAMAK